MLIPLSRNRCKRKGERKPSDANDDGEAAAGDAEAAAEEVAAPASVEEAPACDASFAGVEEEKARRV